MKETLAKLRSALVPLYGKGETEAIIRIIFHYLKGWSLTDILINSDKELSPFIKKNIDDILVRLKNHEPIQYITGEARFYGMTLKVDKNVLIPRVETNELIDLIINDFKDKADLKVLDLCTGSGCISVALARNLRFPEITSIDNSEKALDIARENAKLIKVNLNIINADIFKWNPKEFYDIIVSNPPYVDESESESMERTVLDYEPHDAIFVPDNNPLIFYRRIAEISRKCLNPSGKLYLEFNPRHRKELEELLRQEGFKKVECIKDFFGKDRFIRASYIDD